MPTQSQILQNVINNNDPKGLSGSDANERIMTIIRAMASAIVAGGGGGGSVNLESGVTGILPKGNGGSGLASPSLVAGTNVTVDGEWPNQTVNASGGGLLAVAGFFGQALAVPSDGGSGPPGPETLGIVVQPAAQFIILAQVAIYLEGVTSSGPAVISVQVTSLDGSQQFNNLQFEIGGPLTGETRSIQGVMFLPKSVTQYTESPQTLALNVYYDDAIISAGEITVEMTGSMILVNDSNP